jgi:hypothetical protein
MMLTRQQLQRASAHLDIPLGDPMRFGEKRDFVGDILGLGSDPAPAPNYQPVADASKESAQISAALGREQLDESRRQYERNMAVAQPVIDQQLGLMRQQQTQGDDYYNYMRSMQRPIEADLSRIAMQDNTLRDNAERGNIQSWYDRMYSGADADRQGIMDRYNANYAQNNLDRDLITGGDRGIYNARMGDIEYGVGNAVADARAGQAQIQNQGIRQGMRYGWSPAKLAAALGGTGLGQAAQQATAANSARRTGIDTSRALLAQGYDMRNANDLQNINAMTNNRQMRMDQGQIGLQGANNARNLRMQDDATSWAKKLDAAGLYRGLTGASQGAYSLSNNAGNSAVANSTNVGNSYLSGNAMGVGTTMQGQGLQLQGLGGILNSQTSYANSQNANQGGGLGSLLGTVGGAWAGSATGANTIAGWFK